MLPYCGIRYVCLDVGCFPPLCYFQLLVDARLVVAAFGSGRLSCDGSWKGPCWKMAIGSRISFAPGCCLLLEPLDA